MSGNNGRYRKTRYERDLEVASRHMDIEIFALEIMYSDILGRGIREALDRRQAAFDRMIEAHPDTVAEKGRWQKNREEMAKRMARLRQNQQRVPAQRAARQLARRWGATLVSERG